MLPGLLDGVSGLRDWREWCDDDDKQDSVEHSLSLSL